MWAEDGGMKGTVDLVSDPPQRAAGVRMHSRGQQPLLLPLCCVNTPFVEFPVNSMYHSLPLNPYLPVRSCGGLLRR